MERFFKKKSKGDVTPLISDASAQRSSETSPNLDGNPPSSSVVPPLDGSIPTPTFDVSKLISDPGLRPSIMSYHPNIRDEVRRGYLQNGACQPIGHNFLQTKFGSKMRRFNPKWYKKYPFWLEYSVATEKAYCLCCYLFKQDDGETKVFVDEGYNNWKNPKGLSDHVGEHNSGHNQALSKFNDLMDQSSHYHTFVHKKSKQGKDGYRLRLKASIKCIIYLLKQGLAFRGHDESVHSSNHGNFLELLAFHAEDNEEVKRVVLEDAPQNNKMTSPDIQKDIVSSCDKWTTEISELPSEVLADILSRLTEKSLVQVRSVSTYWRSLIDSYEFLKLRLRGSIQTNTNLSLIIRSCRHLHLVDFNSHEDIVMTVKVEFDPLLESADEFRIYGSANGLICLSDQSKQLALWNPLTGKCQKLPSPSAKPRLHSNGGVMVEAYGFGYDAINDDYKVVKIVFIFNVHKVKVYS